MGMAEGVGATTGKEEGMASSRAVVMGKAEGTGMPMAVATAVATGVAALVTGVQRHSRRQDYQE